jgi:hypothetical protein
MRIIALIMLVVLLATMCGCRCCKESKWESTVNTSTRIYIDRPQTIEAIDVSATLRRQW